MTDAHDAFDALLRGTEPRHMTLGEVVEEMARLDREALLEDMRRARERHLTHRPRDFSLHPRWTRPA